ncbi:MULTISPECIES: low molecular weight protein arginine phosphatase [unclassified Paenibacillus]|uniref:low molecular weight protein arginine phosphatase n=1 Tax=unclassified Paenibacillus TaxID=185978 RepID=UPI0003E2A762|nr:MULTISPECIES: low molecular weight protein arginine phosphatase [unclassified Paenibacillus]ETT42087.1 protein tyrosine phosphatase [Paenibacillus sp. FSL R7-269]OMF91005.1 low molecular weight phosphatase family protein [Paenibacillus sp. FSL R7-0337]
MLHILFVCTGNTCRSPMAEGLLRKLAKERGIHVEVRSAGVSAVPGTSISRHAGGILQDEGIQDRIVSSQLDGEAVAWADLILTLTGAHKRHLLQYFPDAVTKTHTLKEYVQTQESVNADIRELDSLYAEAELNLALGTEPDAAAMQRMIEIRQRIPSFDISDPFGGSREDYELAAAEIRTALYGLLDKLESLRRL